MDQTEPRERRWRGLLAAGALCGLAVLPTIGLAGMLDTPLPTFTDGKTARTVGLLPNVVSGRNLQTVVICSNFAEEPVDIGFEVFAEDGGLRNRLGDPNVLENGEFLNVPVGATVTASTGRTRLITEDHKLSLGPSLGNGSGRVLASSPGVFCIALQVDAIHQIEVNLNPPPTVTGVPVWSCGNGVLDPAEVCDDGNTVGGDGCAADCRIPTCGDVDGNGIIAAADVGAIRNELAGPGAGLAFPERCDVTGAPFSCDVLDVVVLRRVLAIPALAPGIHPSCGVVASGP